MLSDHTCKPQGEWNRIMRIVQLTPGTSGRITCENCMRDNGLAKALHLMNHDILVVPVYLPLEIDETNGYAKGPLFFGGINVFLQQKSAVFRKTPRWVDRFFDSPLLLAKVAGLTSMTKAQDLADTTLSMIEGEKGRQAKELDRLVDWLVKEARPDIIHFSNALLLGMVRLIKQQLDVPILCSLQDEDTFIDPLPEPHRSTVWDILSSRAADVDAFIAVSNFYKNVMADRMRIPEERLFQIYNGVRVEEYPISSALHDPPVIGFIEQLCPAKGLHILADAFVILKKRGRIPRVRLTVAGGVTTENKAYVRKIRRTLVENGVGDDVRFLPHLPQAKKMELMKTLSILSVPTTHPDAFGLYILEALATGVPVVQPDHGAFPELVQKTGGGILYKPNDGQALAAALEKLLGDPKKLQRLGEQGRKGVIRDFHIDDMADAYVRVYRTTIERSEKK